MSTVTKKMATSVMPFAIEAKTPRNQDIIIQCLGCKRLRGAVRASMEAFDRQWQDQDDDESATRPVSANLIDGIGELPGQVLYVDPAELTWKIRDPLWGEDSKLERIRKAMRRALGLAVIDQKLQGMKPEDGTLDVDTMKTLCLELLSFIEAGEARVVKGIKPSKEDIDELPGRYLLNWSNRNKWRQPKYADQYDEWERDMNKLSRSDG